MRDGQRSKLGASLKFNELEPTSDDHRLGDVLGQELVTVGGWVNIVCEEVMRGINNPLSQMINIAEQGRN